MVSKAVYSMVFIVFNPKIEVKNAKNSPLILSPPYIAAKN